jgi:peptidoglycan/xylan/chitin deacetylase (PgdA/CDA1 family)
MILAINYRNLLILIALTNLAYSAGGGIGHYSYTDNFPPSRSHPGDISLKQVPVFICLGFDDNGISGLAGTPWDGGMIWIDTLLASRQNPEGIGNTATFDKTHLLAAFYCLGRLGINSAWHMEDFPAVRESWKRLYEQGHEMGCHSLTHLMDDQLNMLDASAWSVSQWSEEEIAPVIDILTRPYDKTDASQGAGIEPSDLWGWRTPFLHWEDNTLAALMDAGLVYDCSIEDGWGDDPAEYNWPYTLDNKSPGNAKAGAHEGLWEIPCYPFAVPEELRAKAGGKTQIQGLEYTVWYEEALEANDLYSILAYTLDKRLEGNRAPMAIGVHSDVFSNGKDDQFPNASNHRARQQALEQFIDYALTKPEVRFVRPLDLIEWMRNPSGMDGTQIDVINKIEKSGIAVNVEMRKDGSISVRSDKPGFVTVRMTDLSGRSVFNSDAAVSSRQNCEVIVPASATASGTYLISISGNGVSIVKLINTVFPRFE